MKEFLNHGFMLKNETAERLYYKYAANMPIIDYHCHVSPRQIYEDRRFENITELWLGGDHYKWRLMRANGVDEHYITGDADPREKFRCFASALPLAIGNPMYHWCHMELKNYFGYEGILNENKADEVYDLCSSMLKEENMSVRGLIAQSNVEFIGTTDDPADDLEYHRLIAADPKVSTTVAPSFRPDKAFAADKDGWREYIEKLSSVSGVGISSLAALKEALAARIGYFDTHGCRASDHGLDYAFFCPSHESVAESLFQRAMGGEKLSSKEAEPLKTSLLLFCAAEYAKRGWVMQIHYNCLRNPNSTELARLGADTGFDSVGPAPSTAIARLLDRLYATDTLPKTVLYSLDANDNAFLDCIIGAFQGRGVRGKLQHGSAWWFNDHKAGMREHLASLGNLGLLGNFIGMLTDSRSFLSYARHEYFRRILCSFIGELVEDGEYPNDEQALSRIVCGISYENARRYFGL